MIIAWSETSKTASIKVFIFWPELYFHFKFCTMVLVENVAHSLAVLIVITHTLKYVTEVLAKIRALEKP